MFAAAHVDLSMQMKEQIYQLLKHNCDIPVKLVQIAFLKFAKDSTKETVSSVASCTVRTTCHLVTDVAGAAAARLPVRTLFNVAGMEVTETAADSIATAGSMATVRAASLAIGTTVAFAASVLIEIPFFARGMYKLHRKKKFEQIDEVTYIKGCARQMSVSIGTVVCGTAGAVGGSFIPVPVAGTFIGGVAGYTVGFAIGQLVGRGIGYGIGLAFGEAMILDFVIVCTHLYTDYP